MLLSNNEYKIFNDLVESITLSFFDQFLVEKYLDKITMLFIYILEEHVTYPKNAIRDNYCDLPADMEYFDFNDSVEFYEYENETEDDKFAEKVRKNRKDLKIFLNKIIDEVFKIDSFSNRKDFNDWF